MRFTLQVSNPTERAVEGSVWFYMPMQRAVAQTLIGLDIAAEHQVTSDAHGHTVVQLSLELAPLAMQVIAASARVALHDAAQSDPTPDWSPWLRAERYIEADDPRMRAQAAALHKPKPVDTARAIYDWVRGHVEYAGYVAEDLGASYALERRRGDCTEYAYLCAALARANGIAARVLGGWVVDADTAPRAQDYHNWAELHVDGAWRLLDAQKEQWWTGGARYVAFRIVADRATNPIGLAHRFRADAPLQLRF